MDIVAKGRGSQVPLAVRNDAGEALGDLDGLLADGDLGAVRYAVVDAGGLLTHRRYLLPIRLLRYDERVGALRVDIDKDVAARYPAFDADEFERLNDEDRVGYESRLTKFFPREARAENTAENSVADLPEWLIKGTWITVTPQRAERLSDEARTFVNEFSPVSADNPPPARERVVAQDAGANAATRREPPTPARSHDDKIR